MSEPTDESTSDRAWFSVEAGADRHQRIYHSRLQLLDDNWQVQGALAGAKFLNDGVTPIASVLEFALDVNGVVSAQVTRHKLIVNKSPVFSWDEIETPLCALFLGMPAGVEETKPASIEATRSFDQDYVTDPEIIEQRERLISKIKADFEKRSGILESRNEERSDDRSGAREGIEPDEGVLPGDE